jgi:tetratricopeptide (TPR) repeat protein
MRRILPLAILALLTAPALAQEKDAAGSSQATVAVKKLSPAEQRAAELDRLFGQLHAEDAERRAPDIENKIWNVWGRNDSVTAELLLGQASRALNAQEFQAAEDILNRLIADKPDYAEAWNRRATLHFMARRYEKSLSDIEKVLELEPRHFGAISGRGMVLEAMGQPDQALAAFKEALSVNPHMLGVQQKVKLLEKERPEI